MTSLLSLEDWVLVVWDLDWADLAVTSAGQVVLIGLDKVTPVDKTLLVPGRGEVYLFNANRRRLLKWFAR